MIVGNWKMHKTIAETLAFIDTLAALLGSHNTQPFLALPFTSLHIAARHVEGSQIVVGAQNMHDGREGPFTGEVSAAMIADAGARFVLIGHSERRTLFGETDAFINRKMHSALAAQLTPILCIGESEQQRSAGYTEQQLQAQLTYGLEGISSDSCSLAIAYEPVWAIGTGKSATAAQAQQAHGFCRRQLTQLWGEARARQTPILYGGSVKPDNARKLLIESDIDGALIGGASLHVDNFFAIIASTFAL